MSTDWKALCAELLQELEHASAWDYQKALKDQARAALAQPEPDPSQLSDGYHTFAELYEHRHALCLALMRAMPEHCWFSWHHADGERCFGGDDWFIAGIELPAGESVTYHMPAELFQIAQATGAAELEKGRPWDGHSAADVVLRLKAWAALAQPEPQALTVQECNDMHKHRENYIYECSDGEIQLDGYFSREDLLELARTIPANTTFSSNHQP